MSYLVAQLEETPRYENAPVITPYRISTVKTYFPLQAGRIVPNPILIDRSDELRNIEGGLAELIESYEPSGTLSYRAYVNSLIVLLSLTGFDFVATPGGAAVTGPSSTTSVGSQVLPQATFNVASTATFPTSGQLVVAGATGNITYTGVTATSFTGCSGGTGTITAASAVQDNVPATATRWVFSKRVGSGLSYARTAQLTAAYVEHAVFLLGQGFGISNLTLNAQGEVGTDWLGLVMSRIADPALTPSFDAGTITPIRRGDLYLSWLSGTGITDDFSLAIANPLVRRRTLSLGTPSKFPDLMQMDDGRVRLTGTMPKAALASQDFDALMAASTFAAKATWREPVNVLSTNYPYTLSIDMPSCQYIGGEPDELKNARRFGASFNFWAAWDETAGYDVKITAVSSATAISTPF